MKKKLIIFIGITLFISSIIYVFAKFVFNQVVNTESTGGKIVIAESDKQFIKYGEYVLVQNSDNFDLNSKYYVYNSEYDLYSEIELTESTFESYKAAGTLYTYSRDSINVLDVKEGESLNCYATKRLGYSDEDASCPYLNQVGLQFKFKSSIDVYLRIEFKDAWKLKKTYVTTNTVDEKYVTKDKIEGVSPFDFTGDSDDWIYDELNNCAYYKYIIPATCENINDSNASYSSNYEFQVNPEYWYEIIPNIAYREMVMVEVSYNISIVQANRAEKKWQVNFETLGIEANYKTN